jgi:hypothetical protein
MLMVRIIINSSSGKSIPSAGVIDSSVEKGIAMQISQNS